MLSQMERSMSFAVSASWWRQNWRLKQNEHEAAVRVACFSLSRGFMSPMATHVCAHDWNKFDRFLKACILASGNAVVLCF